MTMNTGKTMMVLAVVILLGTAVYAFAGWGMGHGYGQWGHHGGGRGHHAQGWHHGGGGYPGDVKTENSAELEKLHNEFYQATESLRRQMDAKGLALQAELAKAAPDADTAAALQTELSALETEFNQKHLDHLIAAKKLDPDLGRGYGPGGGRGYGPGNCPRR